MTLVSARPKDPAPPVHVASVRGAIESMRLTADLVAEHAPPGGRWERVAVLARHHRQLTPIEALLKRAGIPCLRRGSPRVPFLVSAACAGPRQR